MYSNKTAHTSCPLSYKQTLCYLCLPKKNITLQKEKKSEIFRVLLFFFKNVTDINRYTNKLIRVEIKYRQEEKQNLWTDTSYKPAKDNPFVCIHIKIDR